MDPQSEMTFEQALSALLGFIGERVSVIVFADQRPSLTLAWLEGELSRSESRSQLPMDAHDAFVESLFFVLSRDRPADTGFFLTEHDFRGARWLRRDHTLEITVGPVHFSIVRED